MPECYIERIHTAEVTPSSCSFQWKQSCMFALASHFKWSRCEECGEEKCPTILHFLKFRLNQERGAEENKRYVLTWTDKITGIEKQSCWISSVCVVHSQIRLFKMQHYLLCWDSKQVQRLYEEEKTKRIMPSIAVWKVPMMLRCLFLTDTCTLLRNSLT